jgi:hypothetical protein
LRDLESYRALRQMKSTVKNEEAEQIDSLIHELEKEIYRSFPIAEREFFTASEAPERQPPAGVKG